MVELIKKASTTISTGTVTPVVVVSSHEITATGLGEAYAAADSIALTPSQPTNTITHT